MFGAITRPIGRLTAKYPKLSYYTTTHFWGPVANWGFVIAGLSDAGKDPELISPNMTGVMCVYSLLFMRFAWMIKPRNHLLLACHACNEAVQLNLLRKWYQHEQTKKAIQGPTFASSA